MNLQPLRNRLDRMPMLKALVPFAAGIVLSGYGSLPLWFLTGAFLLSGATALLMRSSAATLGMLLTAGFAAAQLRTSEPDIPVGVHTSFELRIGEMPADRSRYATATARIEAWRDPVRGTWHPASSHIRLYADSLTSIDGGERILCRGTVRPFRQGSESYRKLMRRRGVAGTLWLAHDNLLERLPVGERTLHLRTSERLARLPLTGDAAAVVRAMTAGDRSGLTPELRTAYSRSGLSHLLAVSGLHTGIVFVLINLLLWWLPLLRRGHLLRNLLAVSMRKSLSLSQRIVCTTPNPVRGRLLTYFSAQAAKAGGLEFDVPFNRQQMADYLNLDRSALSKELCKMRDEGLLTFEKNRFALNELPE